MNALDVAVTAIGGAAAGLSAVALWRLRKRPVAPAPKRWPPVLLIRPVEAPTLTELENLLTPVTYGGPLEQVVVGPEVDSLVLRGARVRSDPSCANRKIGHVLAALRRPRDADAVVVVADADVRVDAELLQSLVSALRPGVGLVMAALEPEEGPTWAHAALRATLRETHQDFEVVHRLSVGAVPLCGKVNALSAEAIALLPGCAQSMSEDLAFGALLHANGLRVELAAARARMPPAHQLSKRQVFSRFVRWMQVLRVQRPGLFLTVPVLIAPAPLLLMSVPFTGPVAHATLLVFVAVRTALARRLGARQPLRWLMGEGVLFTAFTVSLFRQQIRWRGRSYPLSRELPAGSMERAR